jgi:hypothetical protein
MAKLKDALIGIEELILKGYTADEVSRMTGMPLKWCIEIEDRYMGLEQELCYAVHSYDNQ